jgi:transcriptional regulator with XRE-family HTH domain
MKTYEKIQRKAYLAGMSIAELCRRTGIHRQTLDKWKRSEPQTIIYLEKINKAIQEQQEENLKQYLKNDRKYL